MTDYTCFHCKGLGFRSAEYGPNECGCKCMVCKGQGYSLTTCPACGGTGRRFGIFTCRDCLGKKVISNPCPVCKGTGHMYGCARCDGTGKLFCPGCEGLGTIDFEVSLLTLRIDENILTAQAYDYSAATAPDPLHELSWSELTAAVRSIRFKKPYIDTLQKGKIILSDSSSEYIIYRIGPRSFVLSANRKPGKGIAAGNR